MNKVVLFPNVNADDAICIATFLVAHQELIECQHIIKEFFTVVFSYLTCLFIHKYCSFHPKL